MTHSNRSSSGARRQPGAAMALAQTLRPVAGYEPVAVRRRLALTLDGFRRLSGEPPSGGPLRFGDDPPGGAGA